MSGINAGRGPAHGGNENHDGDPTHTTLGEGASNDQAPAGADVGDELLDAVATGMPAGVAGGTPHPEIARGPQAYPDGPNVETSPWELEAARGHTTLPEAARGDDKPSPGVGNGGKGTDRPRE